MLAEFDDGYITASIIEAIGDNGFRRAAEVGIVTTKRDSIGGRGGAIDGQARNETPATLHRPR